MNLKKAIKVIEEFEGNNPSEQFPIASTTLLKRVVKALAESDEGKEIKSCLPGRILPGKEIGGEMWVKFDDVKAENDQVVYSSEETTPTFEFGDLVEDKFGIRIIFQTLMSNPKTCWVLRTIDSEGRFIGCSRDIKDLKLIQRGFCNVSLDRIRDKLRSKD